MKTNLYRATIRKNNDKTSDRTIYVASESLIKAAEVMTEELECEEELREAVQVSEECYVSTDTKSS